MKKHLSIRLFILSIFIIISCKKNDDKIQQTVAINIAYSVDSNQLIVDSLLYTNAAGNLYEISKLEYYISNITLHSDDREDYSSDKIFYVNARTPLTNTLKLDSVPFGDYTRITLNIGIDSIHNISYSLPNTSDNINMAWPEPMGGGYHFMKMEGHYILSNAPTGFAVHLGRNPNIVNCTISKRFTLGQSKDHLNLEMDINEWFRNPNTYDLSVDGSYTMGNPAAMGKIANNGRNVFALK